MRIKSAVILVAITLVASPLHILAVEDLKISVSCPDVLLSWPSQAGETYLVRYRPTLNTNTPWVILANSLAAAAGTNRTTFTHANIVTGCSGEAAMAGGSSSSFSTMTEEERAARREEIYKRAQQMAEELMAMLKAAIEQAIANRERWAKEGKPTTQTSASASETTSSAESNSSESVGSTGFYQVFLIPDFWFDYSQYQFTNGISFLPIYLGVDSRMLVKTELLVDGQVFPQTQLALRSFDFGTPGNPDVRQTYGLWVWHDRLSNGTHQFQLRTTLQLDSALTQNTPFLTLTAPPSPTTISNPIIFGPWQNLIVGNSHTFKAQTTIFPATWEIEIYDAYGFFVQSQTGTTTDGNILWTWDLRDSFGNLRKSLESDPFFDPYVTVGAPLVGALPLGMTAATTRPAPFTALDYPDAGGWLVAYQDKDQFDPNAKDAIYQAVLGIAGVSDSHTLPTAFAFLKYGRNVDPDPLQAQKQRNDSWDYLRSQLLQGFNRNFYYDGHGTGFNIGADFDKVEGDPKQGSEINRATYQEGTNVVRSTAYLESGWAYQLSPIYSDAPRPYRFVFLDGCSTAGGDWPFPFGIGNVTNTLADYQNPDRVPNTRPSAFVGWTEDIIYTVPRGTRFGEWGDYQQYADFRSEWIFNWAFNAQTDTLTLALERGRQAGWISVATYQRILRVFGYPPLRYNGFNQRAGWPTQ